MNHHNGGRLIKRRAAAGKRATCSPYELPAAGQVVVAYESTNITWDATASCLTSYKDIDIYLYSVDAGASIHLWKTVPLTPSTLTTTFDPAWWNSSSSASLQLLIAGADQPSWSAFGTGPTFEATFNGTVPATATASGTQATYTGPSVQIISDNSSTGSAHGVTGGKLVAAVLVPILALLVAVAGYLIWSRKKSRGESKRWSAYVDQRMSQISAAHWEQGATPRPSAAGGGGGRVSAANLPRPSYAGSVAGREMAEPNRQSRVSFVDVGHGAGGARHSRSLSQLNLYLACSHSGGQAGGARDFALSPSQSAGPSPLTHSKVDSLAAPRVAGSGVGGVEQSMSKVSGLRYELSSDPETAGAVALSMVAVGDEAESIAQHIATPEDGDHPLSPTHSHHSSHSLPSPPIRAFLGSHHSGSSSSSSSLASGNQSGMKRLTNVRTSTMSPDDALLAYVASRSSPHSPVPSSGETGMRTLYTPSPETSSSSSGQAMQGGDSVAGPFPYPMNIGPGIRGTMFTEGSRYSTASGPRLAEENGDFAGVETGGRFSQKLEGFEGGFGVMQ